MATSESLEAGRTDTGQDLTPLEWHQRWRTELDAAKARLSKWHEQAEKIEARYLDERPTANNRERRRNLFTSNIQTQEAMLYGQTPSVTVSRRFADSEDDVARVAGEALQRQLNTDIERDGDTFAEALGQCVTDLLLAGAATMRLRYIVQTETVPEVPAQVDAATGAVLAPAVPSYERKALEDVESEYVHWKDILWSVSRFWREVRWVAFRAELSRRQLIEKFGPEVGRLIPLSLKQRTTEKDANDAPSPWDRAEVWEVWDKESRRVFCYVADYPAILFPVDNPRGEDPLGLDGFFPCPRPMFRNLTNSKLVPRPDFVLVQDLYNEVDDLATRIVLLQEAIKVAGIYDKTAGDELGRLLDGSAENRLVPCDRWAALAEKGGLRGVVDWFPLEQIVGALNALRDRMREVVEELFQLSGLSDIMRGQGTGGAVTATEQRIKGRFGSVRMQRAQDEIARFASDGQRLKAEIIAKHFDAHTIIERSNLLNTPDAQLAQPAVELLKSNLAAYRIQVKPEAVSLTDFAALKSERTELVGAVAHFLSSATPLAQAVPGSMPFLLRILQWTVAGLRGASQIEGVLDAAIKQAEEAAKQPQQAQQDPKLEQLRLKGQQDLAKVQAELEADLVRSQAKAQEEEAKQRSQTEWNLREAKEREAMKAMRDLAMPRPPGVLP